MSKEFKQKLIKGANISDRTDETTFQNWIDNIKIPSAIPYLIVDTSQPLLSYLNKVIEYIKDIKDI